MNQNKYQHENLLPTFNQSNLERATGDSTASHVNVPYAASTQYDSTHSLNQHYSLEDQNMHVQFPQASVSPAVNSSITQNNFAFYPNLPVHHPIAFFYKPPNDNCNYHISCNEISFGIITQLLNEYFHGNAFNYENEHIFFYKQQSNSQIYQIVCQLVTPLTLNKTVYGIEIEQNLEQLTFTINQKNNLEFYLTQYLSQYLLS